MYDLVYLFGRSMLFVVASGVGRAVCMCSISEVPPKGENTSGILSYYYYRSVIKLFQCILQNYAFFIHISMYNLQHIQYHFLLHRNT